MGRKGKWFSSIKKVFSPNSKEKKANSANKLKIDSLDNEAPSVSYAPRPENVVEISHPHPSPPVEDVKLQEGENEQSKHAYPVVVASAAAAEPEEVVRHTTMTQFTGKSVEEVAAIKIQTAFRGYMARRALRALRGLVRLKSLVDGPTIKRQTASTLKCMQTLSRVHSQIQSRRLRMLEENKALQRQLLQKHAKKLETLKMGEEWDDSAQSKDQVEANMLHKYEAAMRRERALAYSYTHQQTWKKTARSNNLLFMDPTNPSWGWSWLERWMAAETPSATDNRLSTKTGAGEITKSFARYQLNSESPSSPASQKPPPSHPSPATPTPKSSTRKWKDASPRGSVISRDEDSRSLFSVQSERNRRHSIAGSSVRDDESLGSSPSLPSYMAATRSAKAKSRLPSPLGMENGGTPEKGAGGSVKKRLSFPASPARPRRHSGPPKVDISSIADNGVNVAAN